MSHRRAFTILEMLVCTVVFGAVSGLVYQLYLAAANSTGKSVEASDAMRSTLIAAEFIRSDVSRLLLEKPRDDLAVLDGGAGFSIRIAEKIEGDPWTLKKTVITYKLERISPRSVARRLLRIENQNPPCALNGCLLEDMLVRVIPGGQVTPLSAYLEVTLVGLGNATPKTRYTASILMPLNPAINPAPYLAGGGPS